MKVVELAPVRSADVVDVLRRWLERAEAGDVESVAVAVTLSSGSTGTEFQIAPRDRPRLHYAASMLAHRILVADTDA